MKAHSKSLCCLNTLYTQNLLILNIWNDNKPWACLHFMFTCSWWFIKCLLTTSTAGKQGFVGERMRVHTLAGVTEGCCSEVKQKLKYLLSNKGITASAECKVPDRARRSESFWEQRGEDRKEEWYSTDARQLCWCSSCIFSICLIYSR